MKAHEALTAIMFAIWPITAGAQSVGNIGKPATMEALASRPLSSPINWENITTEGLSGKTILNGLTTPIEGDKPLNARGQQDISIYQTTSPSVVLVLTNNGLGSGSYIGSNVILTNAHVVGTHEYAGVVFKPQQEGSRVTPSSIVAAKVLRVDPRRDLAILSVHSVPSYVHPLKLGNTQEILIGADVYAIGHPTGEYWTFTRGLISQVRKDFDWKDESGVHRANVIQTQTPINPGNSGGPLIGVSGNLLGVNSFKTPGSEGVNFAVSVEDVATFLKSPNYSNKEPAAVTGCNPKRLFVGRTKSNDGNIVLIDTNCDDAADVAVITPDDSDRPIQALIESRRDGKVDIIVDDFNRDGLWDVSFYDTQHIGKIDVVGFHPDGKIKASRYEKYDAAKSYRAYLAQR